MCQILALCMSCNYFLVAAQHILFLHALANCSILAVLIKTKRQMNKHARQFLMDVFRSGRRLLYVSFESCRSPEILFPAKILESGPVPG